MTARITKSNQFGTLSEEKLSAFETALGASIPKDYRAFLLRHNGGVPEHEGPEPAEFSDHGEAPFHCFFALHDRPWNDNTMEASEGFPLQEALADFRKDAPESDALPIGKDLEGNYICLGISGPDRGRILLYDHEYLEMEQVAENLDEFLASL